MSDREVIGIDLGGTKALGVVLRGVSVVEERMRVVHGMETDALMAELQEMVEEMIEERKGVEAIGLGIPSQIDHERGMAIATVNHPIENMPIREIFEERFGLPVAVENDANCAAYAESCLGVGRGARVLVCLTVGTGIGSGVVIDGRIFRGSRGYAAEAGHMIVNLENDPSGDFPKRGSLEWLASGSSLERMAEGRSGEEVLDAVRKGDGEMCKVLERLARCLGVGIANMINIFNPDVVAIGGGVSNAGELLLEPARDEAMKWALTAPRDSVDIRLAELGSEAGVVGAALVALSCLNVEPPTR